MAVDEIALAKKVKSQFERLRSQQQFKSVAKLLTYALQILPSEYNRQIFGYIPGIFRQVEIRNYAISLGEIYIGEPIIYKVYYSNAQQLYNLSYFYLFCYLKRDSSQLNVHFQSAHPNYNNLTYKEYDLDRKKIVFEGSTSAFNGDNISVISISDPGQFIPQIASSYYVGSPKINFQRIIANVLEKICNLAKLELGQTLLFGSSAGTFGALLSSTYLPQKTNVLAVNSQIKLQYRRQLMQPLLNSIEPKKLLELYGDRLDCIYRFKQDLVSIPNIYLLANVNDNLHSRNFEFYQLLISEFSQKGMNNQFVFDSYYGVDGHGRPETDSLKAKIRIAREVLTMKSRQ